MHVEFAVEHRAGYLAKSCAGGNESTLPEVKALLAGVRERLITQLADRLGRPRTPALDLAFRAYLGYVDTLTASWLELAETERQQVPIETIAAIATGAFRGSLAGL